MTHARHGLSPAMSGLDELIEHLDGVRARAASAFAAEMFFFARVAALVQSRERERAAQADDGSRVDASQLAMREVYADVAAALQLSEYQVAARINQAYTLVHDFTETLCRVSNGELSPQHAQKIADIGTEIQDPELRAEFEQLALEMATELTPSQLKDALHGVVNRLDPEGTQDRIRDAVAERNVRMRATQPGLGQLVVTGPLGEITGTYNRLDEIATELHADNRTESAEHDKEQDDDFVPDERTRAQIMSDVALDLLLTSAPEGHGATDERKSDLGAIRATVHITIPAGTLAATARGGAEIIGSGAIDDKTAKDLAGNSDAWYRVFTDPATGVPVSVDKRRPCKAQKRLLRARDEHCRFPGCRRPARRCDVDHTIAVVDGGPTTLCNLAHLCERHHTMKHHSDWRVEQLPGGVLQWMSPTRRAHRTRPPGAVRFVPARLPATPRPLATPPPSATPRHRHLPRRHATRHAVTRRQRPHRSDRTNPANGGSSP